jgi:hypothetical protein
VFIEHLVLQANNVIDDIMPIAGIRLDHLSIQKGIVE